jgi:PHD/YefM family antitoxin component YafN of YafNO toxin-antitoxin module
MTRSTDITSFSEYRQHLREHHDRLKQTGRPLYVTTNGETDAIVLSPKAFDELMDKAELAESLREIEEGLEDVRAGRVRPFREAIRDIGRKRGLTIEP